MNPATESFTTEEDLEAAMVAAKKDLDLLVALGNRAGKKQAEKAAEQEPITITTDAAPPPPMNRAERRATVKMYARLLAETNRQTPVVNPTIIPKSKRNRRRSRRA